MRQLTSSGRDFDPALSPDKRAVAFGRATPERKVDAGSDDDTSELWLVRTDGTHAIRLVEPHPAKKMENVIAFINNPHFSGDGNRIYFQTSAWVTSGAVHAFDLKTKQEHFVVAGGGLMIVRADGDYHDCLLVQEHRYYIGGGSCDWYFLLRPDGKEIGPVGEETNGFEQTYATDTLPEAESTED